MFKKYLHVERFGNEAVSGIENGKCYIFPKLDGTNASAWYGGEKVFNFGSRKRQLSADSDNAGFCVWASEQANIKAFFAEYPNHRLFGEWLVPHTFKAYRGDSWRRFFIFDVFSDYIGEYLPYDIYQPMIEKYHLDYIAPQAILFDPSYENLVEEVKKNFFHVQDGFGPGEGIVIKNYNFKNRYGRMEYAKIITNEFKEKHSVGMGCPQKHFKEMVEKIIIEKYITPHFVEKSYSKIITEKEAWESRFIPMLFGLVWYDLINEEIWDITKKMKNPTINFKRLNSLMIMKIKEIKQELF